MKKLLRLKGMLFLAAMLLGGVSSAWAQSSTVFYSNDYEDGVLQWTTATSGRFTPVIMEDDTKYVSVDQETRNNNGTTISSQETNGKVEAGTDFTFACRVKLGASTDQAATAFNIYDATNSTKILSLAEVSTNATAWTVNDNAADKVTVSAGGGKALSALSWINLQVTYQDGFTYLTVTSADGTVIDGYEKKIITTLTEKGGLGKLEFVTSRYNANFAIDDIVVRPVQESDVPVLEKASYTINYLYEGSTIKTETAIGIVGNTVEAESPITIDEQKYYIIDGEIASMEIKSDEAENVLSVNLRKAEVWNYTVNATAGEKVIEIVAATAVEGDVFTQPIPRYLNVDGAIYTANIANNAEASKSIMMTQDNLVVNVPMTATGTANVIYFSEAEDIEGMKVANTGGVSVRCSFMAGGYTSEVTNIVTLTAGTYKLFTAHYANASTTFNFVAGEETVLSLTGNGSWTEVKTENEFTLTEETTLTVQGGSDGNALDYIYITSEDGSVVETPEDPLAELKATLNMFIEMYDGQDLSGYTDESAAALTKAIEDAKAAVADPNATEKSLMEAYYALAAALEGLEEKPVDEGNWTTVGTAILEDPWVLPGLGIDQHKDENKWEVELQRNEENESLYRLVDPYHAEGPVKAYNESEEVGYIVFDVTDPEHVLFAPETKAGFKNRTSDIAIKVNEIYAYNRLTQIYYHHENGAKDLATVIAEYAEDIPFTTFKDGVITLGSITGMYDACFGDNTDPKGLPYGFDWENGADMTGSITLKIDGAGDEPKDDEVVVTLVHTAAVQGGSNEALKTLDTATHYYNNWGSTAWAGQAYAGFAWTLPTNEVVVSATLKYYSNCGGNNNTRPMQVYYKDGTGFDYEGIELTDATGTLLKQVDDHLAVEEKTIDATDAVKDIISQGSSDIVFIFGGAAAGATLYGKGSADKAPQLIIETIDISETTSYTVNFVDAQNNVLKEAVVHTAQLKGAEVTASADEMAAFKDEDASKKYIYVSGNEPITLVEDATANVITLVFREAEVWNYTVNATVNDEPIKIVAGTAFEGDTFTQPIPRLLNVDGTIYTAGLAGNVQASKDVTMSADNVVVNVAMTATETTDVIFFAEAEDILTLATGGNVPVRCSFMAGGYAEEAAEVVTLNAGVYKITTASYAGSSTNFTFTAGDNTVLTVTGTDGWAEVSSNEFTLTESTTLTVQGGTTANALDYIYITGTVTTGINTVKSEFENGAVYNLQGQKVEKAQKGLYIINGKKMVVK